MQPRVAIRAFLRRAQTLGFSWGWSAMTYLGQSHLGQVNLGQVNLGQVNLGQVNLGQAYLGQANAGQALCCGVLCVRVHVCVVCVFVDRPGQKKGWPK